MGELPNLKEKLPPERRLFRMISAKIDTHLLSVVAELGIADLLKDGPRPIEELAKITDTHAPSLYRVLRALASQEVFIETEPRCFGLTPMAEKLRSDVPGSLRPNALLFCREWHNKAWSNLMHSVKTGECAFDHVYGMKIFDFLEQNQEESSIFNAAMTSGSSNSARQICDAYDFSGLHTLVDVGGGHGMLLSTILKANPGLKGILFDLPSVVEGAHELLDNDGLKDRCQIIGGDFFESVPAGADAYLFKSIIHDWDNERATIVLKNCKKAMTPKSRVLVVDAVIPVDNSPFPNKLTDIEMMVLPGGLERTEEEFGELFLNAGLKMNRIIPTGMTLSIIEGVVA